MEHQFNTLETNVVHAGARRIDGAVITPIFQSANFLMRDEATYDAMRYLRLSNSPSHYVLHDRLAACEGGEAALVFSTGMAAIVSTMLAFLNSGDHLLVQKTLYGGTQNFLDDDGPGLKIEHTAIDPAGDPSEWEKALRPETKVLYAESISNPLMEVGDLRALVAFAKKHDLVTIIDNTFASPVNFRPMEIGFDLVVHSATKYLNGHSDIVAGAVMGSEEYVDRVRHKLIHFGGSLDPHACFLFERGLKTLAIRVERQNANAQKLAEFLDGHDAVARVRYPGLPSDPGHAAASDLFDGYGGMLSFELKNAADGERVLGALRIPLHAASLGGVESLVVRPSRSSHLGMPVEDREKLGITDGLIRVSVGIEDGDELVEDFRRALD